MRLRTPLAVALLACSPAAAQAHNPLCCKLFGHGTTPCQTCAPDCQVHVHYCKAPAACGEVSPPMRQPMQQPMQQQFTPQMLYSPILPSTVGFTMPMMPMMGTPMAYQPQFAAPQFAPAPQQSAPMPSSAPNCAPAGNCGDCEPRVARLEQGVKNLSERMDRIETILENQTAILKRLAENVTP
jgi:hypothetical protein